MNWNCEVSNGGGLFRRVLFPCIACLGYLATGHSALATIVTLQSGVNGQSEGIIQESMLIEEDTTKNFGGRDNLELGVFNTNRARTAVMRFDVLDPSLGLYVGGVPQFSSIDSITLQLTTTSQTANATISDNMDLRFAANTDAQGNWVEGTKIGSTDPSEDGSVTYGWRQYNVTGEEWVPDGSWTRGEGDGVLATATSFPGVSTAFTVSFTAPGINGINTLADLVNGWATGNNEGILINDVNRSGNVRWFINSSESETLAARPLLTIEYTPVPEPGSFAMLALGSALVCFLRRKGK